jgi:uncharacterized protein (DUF433 family)
MTESRIVDRGDGPKVEGTRITVYTILEYLRAGRTRDWIAAMLNLSSRQVQAAIDYIRDHKTQVTADYEKILARIKKGNSEQVLARLRENRETLRMQKIRRPTYLSKLR